MKDQEELKPKDPREKALARLFCHEEYSEELRRFSFQEAITNWPEAKTCRYAMSALLSCALKPGSLLYTEAHEWISKHDPQGSILLAIAIHEASFSEARRDAIWKELFDRHNIALNIEHEALWRKSRDRFILWGESGPGLPLAPWYPYPPKDQPELYDSLMRVMENPEPDVIWGRTMALIDDPQLENMPYLRTQMIEVVTEASDPLKVIEVLRPKAPLFAAEISDYLVRMHIPYTLSREKEEPCLHFIEGIFGLAELLKMTFSALAPEKAKDLANKLVDAGEKPWVWPLAAEICQFADKPDDVADFLENWLMHRSDEHRLPDQAQTKLRTLLAEMRVDQFLRELSAPLAIAYTTRIGGDIGPDVQWDPIAGLIAKYPAEFQQAYGQYVREGRVRLEFVLRYIEALGESVKEEFQEWLNAEPLNHYLSRTDIDQLLGYINQFNLSAGNLVRHHTKELVGPYNLRPEDVDSPKKVAALLPIERGALIKAYKPAVFWGNQQWREMVLRSGHETVGALKSFFASVSGWLLNEIGKAIIPLCEEDPKLRRALCLVAWDKDFSRAARVQELLAQDVHRYIGWMRSKDREKMYQWYFHHIQFLFPAHRPVVDAMLSREDQRTLLFESLVHQVDQGTRDDLSLPDPESWAHLFDKPDSQARLLQWLKVHRGGIDVKDWLNWINRFGFGADPEIKRRVHELLDHKWEDVRGLALQILT